jgi:hypothetical protein
MSKDKKKKSDRLHDLYMQQRAHHLEQEKYASGRFDVTIVTLSGAAIIAVSEFHSISKNKELLIVSTVLFCVCIVLNLIGQLASMSAHSKDAEYTDSLIRDNSNLSGGKNIEDPSIQNSIISVVNCASVVFFLLGLCFFLFGIAT